MGKVIDILDRLESRTDPELILDSEIQQRAKEINDLVNELQGDLDHEKKQLKKSLLKTGITIAVGLTIIIIVKLAIE
jgi:hypothetical protein